MGLTEATVTGVQVVGMGDRVCVDLCSIMLPGEGLLVRPSCSHCQKLNSIKNNVALRLNFSGGIICQRPFPCTFRMLGIKLHCQPTFPGQCGESNYIWIHLTPFTPWFQSPSNEKFQGPVHAYVAVPGGRTCYLSELQAGKEVIIVDQRGGQRVAIVGRVKVESRPLILVEAKVWFYPIQPNITEVFTILRLLHLLMPPFHTLILMWLYIHRH